MMEEENIEIVEDLEAQISRFQAEIQELQRIRDNHNDMQFHQKGPMQDALAFLCGQSPGQKKESLMSRLKEEVEELKEHLREQTEMNGISLDSINTNTRQCSDAKQVQCINVTGRCSQIGFRVEFLLTENKEDQQREKSISCLTVMVGLTDRLSFRSFLSIVHKTCDLPLFSRTLRAFTARRDDRAKTFEHFQKKYPTIVSLPGGSESTIMTMKHPQRPGCALYLFWSVEVFEDGAVKPKFSVFAQIPEEVEESSPSLYGGAANAFKSLQELLGVEAAIESLIRAVNFSPHV